jgi:outer membrane translocation and assembly module TamA
MRYTLAVIGSIVVLDAEIPEPPASSDRFYAGGFQSVRGFNFRGAALPIPQFHAGGFRSIRGFEFRETGPVSERFYAGGFPSLRGFQLRDVTPSRDGK